MRTDLPRHRPDPAPLGWEVPVAAALVWCTAAAALLPAGQALAAAVTGRGWAWPAGPQLTAAAAGLLTGHPGVGLPAGQVPPAWLAYAAVGLLEGALVAATGWAAARWWATIGPGRRTGFAGRADAEQVLGVARLRKVQRVIRPDLPGTPAPRPGTGPGAAGPAPVGSTRRLRLRRRGRVDPEQVGWRLGRGRLPRTGPLWVPFDRTMGVYGPQGSGKTLDLLTPALLHAPGAALVTLTKVDDLLLTVDRRGDGGRPVAVLDPFGLAPGLPELVWDPISGCADSMVAERRAKAFTAGTVRGAVAQGTGDSAARFYAAEAAKVLQAYFHAAALTGRTLEHVLDWVANPRRAATPEEVLRTHPHAAPFWHGLLHGALHGDERTAGNTITTVQQAIALFFQQPLRDRCVPGPHRPGTDLADLITRRGTVYLLGRDDPYAPASPLMTAVAEHVLDTALQLAGTSPHGRACPPFLACLDELPSTAPLPTLRTRMANERALGLSFIYAAQTWRQLVICYGEDEARALFGLTNVIAIFGGSKDGLFNRELSELLGTARVTRTTHTRGWQTSGSSHAGTEEPVLRPEEIRLLPQRHALVVPENAKPLIARLDRCIDGTPGQALLARQAAARRRVEAATARRPTTTAVTAAAVHTARQLDLTPTDTRAGTVADRPATPAGPAATVEAAQHETGAAAGRAAGPGPVRPW